MKNVCPICLTRKPQRRCWRMEMSEVCSQCCAGKRDETCAECLHYTQARKYTEAKQARRPPGGHFIAEIDPEVESAVDAALAFLEQGQTEKARREIELLLREHPRNHTVLYAMGVLHAVAGDHKEAVRWFDQAIAIFPYLVEAHYNKAVACQKDLDIAGAVRAYRKVLEIGDPGEEFVRNARSSLDGIAEAIRSSDGVDLDAYMDSQDEFNRAFGLMEKGYWGAALAGFRAAATLNDRNAPTHGNMGMCLAQLGRKTEALAELDRVLEIDPAYEPARMNRIAVAKMEEGQPLRPAGFKRIEFSKEQMERKRQAPRSLLSRLSGFFSKRHKPKTAQDE